MGNGREGEVKWQPPRRPRDQVFGSGGLDDLWRRDEPDDLPADFLRRHEVPPPNTSRDAVFAQPQWSCADETGRLDAAGSCVAVAEKPDPPRTVACRQPVMSVSKSTKPHPDDAGSRRRLGFGAVWLAVWLAVGGCFGLGWLKTAERQPESGSAFATSAADESQVVRRTTKIEDIRPGDYVLSRDPETGEITRKRVLDAFTRTADHLRILKLRSSDGTVQELHTTDEHPFWVSETGFVPAGELKVGDKIDQSDGHPATVISTRYEPHPEGQLVYNFTVEGNHTYFVAANGTRAPPVFVHNAGCRERAMLESQSIDVGAEPRPIISQYSSVGDARSSTKVFRQGTFADEAAKWDGNYVKGKQWATDNPVTTPDYAKKYGLPVENTGKPDWVVGGRTKGPYTTRPAPPSHNTPANTGGGTEMLPKNVDDVMIDWFHMPD